MKRLLLFFVFVLAALVTHAQTVDVTLTVDASNETVDATGVHVAGNWDSENEWNPSAFPMNDNGDGTWSLTIQVAENSTFEYKYLLGNDWSLGDEGISDDATCIVGDGNTNRILAVDTSDITMPTVCYNSCASCKEDGEATVEFSLDMSLTPMIADSIIVTGSFAGWTDSIYMIDYNQDSIYHAAVNLPIGDTIEYKFKNGPDGWESVSGDCTQNGNRFLVVEEDAVLPVVCFEKCDPCVVVDSVYVTFMVDMSNEAIIEGVSENGIHVAGNFQGEAGFGGDWNPGATRLTDADGDSIYNVTVYLPEGDYEYKFVNGNDWGLEEPVPIDCRVEGTSNRGFNVTAGDADTIMVGPVCFGACEASCPALLDPVNVTFRVDMRNEFLSQDGLFVTGDFKNPKWDRDTFAMMETETAGIYSYTTEIRPGFDYQYKFVNGGTEATEESFAFKDNGCGVDNGFGGSNRFLQLAAVTSDTLLPVYVYNSCETADLSTSTHELTAIRGLKAFPNPASTQITVQFERLDNSDLWFELRDFSGRVLRTQAVGNANQLEIPRNGLSAGLYIGTIRNEQGNLRSFRFSFQ